jgi:plastocyanin
MAHRTRFARAAALAALTAMLPTCTLLWHAGDYEFDRTEGACTENEPVADDGDECTDDVCVLGTPRHPPSAAGKVCSAGVCDGNGTCTSADCLDGELDGTETDVDCGGGACPPCPGGLICEDAADCQSAVCMDMLCQYPTCIDGVQNGDETDLDCGGGCPGCPDGDGCAVAEDCANGVCMAGVCQAPTCTDMLQNGAETDVDCGGTDCGGCADGEACLVPGDCTSNVCTLEICVPQGCNDSSQNGSETDVDCGGPDCAPCADGDGCMLGSDCQSGLCQGMTCQTGNCMDMVENGSETDVDCGGSCPPCAVGEGCSVDGDCTTTVCLNSSCSPLNGCNPLTASDYTAQSTVTIAFQGMGNMYNPPCIRVLPGTMITFSGNFSSHNLQGGKVIQGVKYPDSMSPFFPATSSGNSKAFTLPQSGQFPYYCIQHGAGGMTGVVFVQ